MTCGDVTEARVMPVWFGAIDDGLFRLFHVSFFDLSKDDAAPRHVTSRS